MSSEMIGSTILVASMIVCDAVGFISCYVLGGFGSNPSDNVIIEYDDSSLSSWVTIRVERKFLLTLLAKLDFFLIIKINII